MALTGSIRKNRKWITQALTNHQSFKDFFEPVVQIAKPNWQVNDYTAQVIDNRIENDLVYSLVLKPSNKWKQHIAGQHVNIQLEINGVRYKRIFSISSSPNHYKQAKLIELTIRKQEHGKVTQWMAKHLLAGSTVRISAAQGTFTLPDHTKPLLLIAGGSGITPFRSFLHQLASNNAQQNIHLIYYNQSITPLFDTEWKKLGQDLKSLNISLIDTDVSGLISAKQLQQLCPDFPQRKAYLCGPHGLITTSRDLLIGHGVEATDIHHELFGPRPVTRTAHIDSPNQASVVTFIHSNTQVKAEAQQSLLELAEATELNPPSGCRMGVCRQCTCSKKQGVVYNTLNNTYSDTGSEEIQLCVSIAVGDVTLDL